MYIFISDPKLLVIITIKTGQETERKMRRAFAVLCVLIFVCLCGCVSVGETDIIDFTSRMARLGCDCSTQECLSGEGLSHIIRLNGCRLRLNCNGTGAVESLSLTFYGTADSGFYETARAAVMSLCGYDEAGAQAVLSVLGADKKQASTNGVNTCTSGEHLFSFTCDKSGGLLKAENIRLNPTQQPTVTVRTTVPSAEKAEAAP